MQTPFKISADRCTNKKAKYNQVGQARPCKFSFAEIEGDTVYYLTKPVLCRDYLNDTLVWDELEDKSKVKEICGYKFTGPINRDNVILYMEDAEYLLGKENMLEEYEKPLGLKPIQFLPTVKKDCVVVIADPWWQSSTLQFSWLTQLLRHLTYPSVTELKAPSREMMIQHLGDKYWELPFKAAKLKFTERRIAPRPKEDPESWLDESSLLHSYSGFFGFLTTSIKQKHKEEYNSL